MVEAVLAALDTVACDLFPAWLPGAEHLDGPGGAGVPAVRRMALRAATAERFGPFLADLAERALRRGPPVAATSAEVRVRGLTQVVATSFGRAHAALLIIVPQGLDQGMAQALIAAARWLAEWGGCGAWLTGGPLPGSEPERVTFRPRGTGMPIEVPPEPEEPVVVEGVRYPALTGRPHPRSDAEQSLEAGLATCPWASGRAWNQEYQQHPLTNPVRLDLVWHAERCVVELDGPEHRDPVRFAEDHQRDVLLQLAGYAVLRFTNAQVIQHRDRVLAQIQTLLEHRRATSGRAAYSGRDFDDRAEASRAETVRAGTRAAADPDGREQETVER